MNRYWNWCAASKWIDIKSRSELIHNPVNQNRIVSSSIRKLDSDAQQMQLFAFYLIARVTAGGVTITRTISCATASGTSFSRSKVNSMAPPSLYLPFSLRGSSTHIFSAMDVFIPSSSSASSTLTPVSSAKKAWFSRSLMEYLWTERIDHRCLTFRKWSIYYISAFIFCFNLICNLEPY